MPVTDIFRINQIKAELEQTQQERDSLKLMLAEMDKMTFAELKAAIADLEKQKAKANQELEHLKTMYFNAKQIVDQKISDLDKVVEAKQKEIIVLDEELLLQSFGFYKLHYDLQNSEMYKARLERIRTQQAAMVKEGTAALCPTAWVVNDDKKEGARMIKDYTKLIVRSFNNECDASIVNVKFNNMESIEKKIRKAFDTLNSLAQRMSISITNAYLNLKLEELYLCYEYQLKKQEEKEEQKRLREQMREEAKLIKEIEEAKLKIEKEEKHFAKAIQTIDLQLQKTQTDAERQALELEKASIEKQLEKTEKNKLDVLNREQNTRAGYVYIISNVGSFGENVYKIGVTRRLDPTERVDELGDASVPFGFDIHATIFSDDAPTLENALHKAFTQRRLNMINMRREFFHVTLDEIETVVKSNFNKPVEFTRLADAAEYRQSVSLRETGKSN
jgi:hypothetical protein